MSVDGACNWIMRVDVDDDAKFVQEDTHNNSMIVLNENPEAILEYRSNKMIITLIPADVLITENWQPIRHVQALIDGNIQKYFLCRHPEFDEVKFPFIIASGYEFYVIINVNEFRLQRFIDSSNPCAQGQ